MGRGETEVARQAHNPILLLPPDRWLQEPLQMARAVLALDGSKLAESVIPHALQLGSANDTTFVLLRIVQPSWTTPGMMSEPGIEGGTLPQRVQIAHDYVSLLAERLRERVPNVTTEVLVTPDVPAGILDFARRQRADVIALATRGHGGLKRLLLGSVANKILRAGSVPVLLYNPA